MTTATAMPPYIVVPGATTTRRGSRSTTTQPVSTRKVPFATPAPETASRETGRKIGQYNTDDVNINEIENPSNKLQYANVKFNCLSDDISKDNTGESDDNININNDNTAPSCGCPLNDDLSLLLTETELSTEEGVPDLPPNCGCHDTAVGSCPDNISTTINLIKCVVESGVPNRDGVRCPVGSLNTAAWEERLQDYHDKEDVLAGTLSDTDEEHDAAPRSEEEQKY